MADLIDRQAAIDGIESLRPIKPTRGETSMEAVNRSAWECAINCAESFVRTMPPYAQPERTGRWIKDRRASLNGGSYEVFVCSECESAFNWRMRYCGHCGAKMEVEHDG